MILPTSHKIMMELISRFPLVAFLFLTSTCFTSLVQSICSRGCDLALASYYLEPGNNLHYISRYMNTDINNILKYNLNTIRDKDILLARKRINLPFSCDCINGEFLGHVFNYELRTHDTYELVAKVWHANLTSAEWIKRFNGYDSNRLPDGGNINVTVNCSCGDSSISKDYGLFLTYPIRHGETLESISFATNLSSDLIRSYNPDIDFNKGSGLIYIPAQDENGYYPPFKTSSGLSSGFVGGITVGVVAVVLVLAGFLYSGVYRNKNAATSSALLKKAQVQLMPIQAPIGSSIRVSESSGVPAAVLTGITVDTSVEFSYEELSAATLDFSLANKIGQGGFGAVYYAELRGEKVAIKKMDMEALQQFLTELKVLTHVHHQNLVHLIGYCINGSLFLVYEYIENGNLSQHLHGAGRDTLPWSVRVQIALDLAKGLEYIHEHMVPVYVHCDIKSENILINKNFHGKVADFGVSRLTHAVGSISNLAGTFGYMPPEYVRYGEVSPKVDVYAFGVVLYELISAKQAIIIADDSDDELKGLVTLFDEVLSLASAKDDLVKMIDPRLGDDYTFSSVQKMAQLAKACTREDPQLRPSMSSIVVALMTLLSSMKD